MSSTILNFIKGFELLGPHYSEGFETTYFLEAEHECIYTHISVEQLPLESVEGKLLSEYGFDVDECDVWIYRT